MAKRSQAQLKNYRWKGTHRSGKRVSGQLLALNETEVRDKLKQQKIRIRRLKAKRISTFTRLAQRVTSKDVTLLTRQLATMLATGVPIIHALKLVADNHRKAEMKSILAHISKAVESGTPVSKAMHTSSRHFDSLYVDLVTTGEQTGNLAEAFERIAIYREKSERLKAKVIKALIYPCMVVVTALTVSYLMLTMVIPQFESMFKDFGADLPWFTEKVLQLSYFTQTYGSIIFLALGGLVFIMSQISKRSSHARLAASRLGLKIPIIGAVMGKASIAKFSRTLATSLNAGIPILSCLTSSAKTADNTYYQQAIERIYDDTAAGVPIYIAMRNSNCFPEMILQMVMIGEESGRLDEMLNKVAAIYEFEVENTVDNLGKVLEPMIIVFLGVVVGGLVIAMYLPIFNLMSVLG
ncbi:type II secretion system F family protein [Vibrio ouci]|uniref:Type II secretion system F family protein n=1 Tax=Vibrio ouci TaxID=2499078 RepID=A0A4Y8WGJ6_9VIBR|nr:type II secretion system F family protein [Vibrio ouci]TFH91431.1 type II secretion system F family protein [Vibrio ouci]